MKKTVIALLTIAALGSAEAHGSRVEQRGSGWGWVGPAVVGTMIGYEIARAQQPQAVYSQPQAVYSQQPVIQPEVRMMPQYSPAYPAPNGCFPVYTAQGQFIGQMCR